MEMLFAVVAVNFLDFICSYLRSALCTPASDQSVAWPANLHPALARSLKEPRQRIQSNLQVANNFSCQRTEVSFLPRPFELTACCWHLIAEKFMHAKRQVQGHISRVHRPSFWSLMACALLDVKRQYVIDKPLQSAAKGLKDKRRASLMLQGVKKRSLMEEQFRLT